MDKTTINIRCIWLYYRYVYVYTALFNTTGTCILPKKARKYLLLIIDQFEKCWLFYIIEKNRKFKAKVVTKNFCIVIE